MTNAKLVKQAFVNAYVTELMSNLDTADTMAIRMLEKEAGLQWARKGFSALKGGLSGIGRKLFSRGKSTALKKGLSTSRKAVLPKPAITRTAVSRAPAPRAVTPQTAAPKVPTQASRGTATTAPVRKKRRPRGDRKTVEMPAVDRGFAGTNREIRAARAKRAAESPFPAATPITPKPAQQSIASPIARRRERHPTMQLPRIGDKPYLLAPELATQRAGQQFTRVSTGTGRRAQNYYYRT